MSTSNETIDNPDRPWKIYPRKFWTKQSFSLEILQNWVTPIGNSIAKNQDHWKLYMLFLWYPYLEISGICIKMSESFISKELKKASVVLLK